MDYAYKESIANHLGQWIKAKSCCSLVDDPELILRVCVISWVSGAHALWTACAHTPPISYEIYQG